MAELQLITNEADFRSVKTKIEFMHQVNIISKNFRLERYKTASIAVISQKNIYMSQNCAKLYSYHIVQLLYINKSQKSKEGRRVIITILHNMEAKSICFIYLIVTLEIK